MNSSISATSCPQPEERTIAGVDQHRSAGGNRRRRLYHLFALIGALWLVFPLTTCGLDVMVYLEPPREDTVSPSVPIDGRNDPAASTFRHNRRNNIQEFLGYEVYYRFYVDGDGVFPDHKASIANANSLRPDTQLEGLGYRRLAREGSSTPPLIRIPEGIWGEFSPNDPLNIATVFFPSSPPAGAPDDDAYVAWPTTPAETNFEIYVLRRTVSTAGDQRRFFPIDDTNYDKTVHYDIPATVQERIGTNDINEINLALFVFAYGIDYSSFRPIFSEAVPLMYANLLDLD